MDSTNIVRADASVITSVSFDHEELLGNSIERIAREKAGIIKPGTKVFIGDIPEAAEAAMAKVAQEVKVPLIKASTEDLGFESSLKGDFQKNNTKLAHTILKILAKILPISDNAIKSGFASTFWPARNQTVLLKNDNKMIFDGVHNWEAVKAQVGYIGHTVSKDSTSLIFGSTKIRHYEACFAALEPLFHRIFVTNISDIGKKFPTSCSLHWPINTLQNANSSPLNLW